MRTHEDGRRTPGSVATTLEVPAVSRAAAIAIVRTSVAGGARRPLRAPRPSSRRRAPRAVRAG